LDNSHAGESRRGNLKILFFKISGFGNSSRGQRAQAKAAAREQVQDFSSRKGSSFK
jgi:hypothetical protein